MVRSKQAILLLMVSLAVLLLSIIGSYVSIRIREEQQREDFVRKMETAVESFWGIPADPEERRKWEAENARWREMMIQEVEQSTDEFALKYPDETKAIEEMRKGIADLRKKYP